MKESQAAAAVTEPALMWQPLAIATLGGGAT